MLPRRQRPQRLPRSFTMRLSGVWPRVPLMHSAPGSQPVAGRAGAREEGTSEGRAREDGTCEAEACEGGGRKGTKQEDEARVGSRA
eukprot:4453667-Alexandrium_andersonii.AAC.1